MDLAYFKLIVDSFPFGFCLGEIKYDSKEEPIDYTLTILNRELERIIGVDSNNIIGVPASEINFRDHNQFKNRLITYSQVVNDKVSISNEYFSHLTNKWYKVDTFSPYDNIFICTYTDISNIREQKDLLQGLIDGIPDILGIQTPDHRIVKYNKAGYDFFGKEESEIVGKKCYELLGLDKNCQQCATIKALETKMPQTIIKYKEDSDIYLDCTSIPILDHKGNPYLVFEQIRDITKQKKSEIELIKAKKEAQNAVKIKTEFLNNISHEIKTPLNSILGFSYLIAENGIDRMTKEECLVELNKSAKVLMSRIDDILDMSLISINNIPVKKERVNVNELVRDIYTSYKSKLGLSSNLIEYRLNLLNTENPIYIECDWQLINKAITHLLDNSFKFTLEGFVELGISFAGDGDLNIYVKDSGVGISAENLTKLTDPFYQEDASSIKKFGGVGLGLSIVNGIARILGVKFSIDSKKGYGTFALLKIGIR